MQLSGIREGFGSVMLPTSVVLAQKVTTNDDRGTDVAVPAGSTHGD
jgi:hypothetical protein